MASTSTAPTNQGAGGGGGGGGYGGASSGPSFHNYPPARLEMKDISGTEADFTPSAFLPFDKAVAKGQAVLDAQKKTLVEAAAASSHASQNKAKVVFEQDADGNAIAVAR